MKLLSTRIAGFGPHIDTVIEWENTAAVVALVAKNGAGKTLLMEAIIAALYGDFPSYDGNIYDALTDGGSGKGELEIEIEIDDNVFRIHRVVKGGNNPSQKVYVYSNDEQIAGYKVRDAEEKIESIFGPKRVAMASWFSGQGGAGDLASLSAADRRVVFADLLNLNELESVSVKARIAASNVKDTIQSMEGAVEQLGDPSEELKTVEDTLLQNKKDSAEVAELIADLEQKVQQVYEQQQRRKQLDSLKNDRMVATSNLATLQQRKTALGTKPPVPETPRDEVTAFLNAERDAKKQAESRKNQINADKAAKQAAIRQLEATEAATPANLSVDGVLFDDKCTPCPLYQYISNLEGIDSNRAGEIDSLLKEIASSETSYADILRQIETAESQIKHWEALLEQHNAADNWQSRADEGNYDERIATEKASIVAIDTQIKEIEDIVDEDVDLTLASQLTTAKNTRDLLIREEGRAANSKESLEKKQETLKEKLARLKELREEFDELKTIQKAFSRQGVQALLVDQALGELETKTNENLAVLSDNRFSLSIQTQTENKTGGVREDLAIMIQDAYGEGERPIGRFSGGERRLFQTALRLALTLWSGHGQNSGTLCIDEAFDALDDDRSDNVITLLTQLEQEFNQIIVITHNADLASRLPAQITLGS